MLHILRIHSGWLPYVSDDNMRLLWRIRLDDIFQQEPPKPITEKKNPVELFNDTISLRSFRSFKTRSSVENVKSNDDAVDVSPCFAAENGKHGLYYLLLAPTSTAMIKNNAVYNMEVESPLYWRIQYQKEAYKYIKKETLSLLDEICNLDLIGDVNQIKKCLLDYADKEMCMRVHLVSMSDDEMFEGLYLRTQELIVEEQTKVKQERELLDNTRFSYLQYTLQQDEVFDSSEVTGNSVGKIHHQNVFRSQKNPMQLNQLKKTLDTMNWRGFELVHEYSNVYLYLLLLTRMLIRVKSKMMTIRKPMLNLENILYFMYLVDEHRSGSYFPTCFNGYDLGERGFHVNQLIYIYLRDALLDEFTLHIYSKELFDLVEEGKIASTSENVVEKAINDNNMSQKWDMFMQYHIGHSAGKNIRIDGEVKLDLIHGIEDMELEIYGNLKEDEIPSSMASLVKQNRHKNYKPINNMVLDNGIKKDYVLQLPPEGNTSKIVKRMEIHENMIIDYNIKKIKESMLLMQEEHNMEMRIRKVKEAYMIPSKEVFEDNLALTFKAKTNKSHEEKTIDDEFISHYDAMGKKKLSLTTSLQSILNDFPIPEVMKRFNENKEKSIENTYNLKVSESAAYLRDFCVRVMNYDENTEKDQTISKKQEQIKKKSLELYEEYTAKIRKRDTVKECGYIAINMLTYQHVTRTCYTVFPNIVAEQWIEIQKALHYLTLTNALKANETQMVIDAHEWIALYLKNRPWKRECYKRSGISKPNSLDIESWRFAESEYTIRNFTTENLFEELLPLLETHYYNEEFIDILKTSQQRRPITEHLYLGTYLMGYYHAVLKTMNDKEIQTLKIGAFLDPKLYHPFQNDILAFIIHWWLQQQLRQLAVDVNRSIFYWELEYKYYNIYRGEIQNPVITRVGGDWCVFDGFENGFCKWTAPNTPYCHLINCGDSILRAFYVWMICMEKVNWIMYEREPSIRLWNEFIKLDDRDKCKEHRQGSKIVNLTGNTIQETYRLISTTIEKKNIPHNFNAAI